MIVLYPDIRLRGWCRPVEDFTQKLFDHIQIMKDYAGNPCINNEMLGVAANQLGFTERFFLFYDIENRCNEIAINPCITYEEGPVVEQIEGCLSVPDRQFFVPRPELINTRYNSYNNDLKQVTRTFKGLAAQIFCHEIDHLNGKLVIDVDTRPISRIL